VQADERSTSPSPDGAVFPLLKARCVKCHGPAKREGGLNLATPKGLARGGKQGAAVVAGEADESLLWQRGAGDERAPKEPLSEPEKEQLRRWIERGAPGLPKVVPGEPEGADHWAFAPASAPEPPRVRDASRARTAVDRFLLAKLDDGG